MKSTPAPLTSATLPARPAQRSASKLVRRRPAPLALEQRFMFDGAAVADALDTTDALDSHDSTTDVLDLQPLALEAPALFQTELNDPVLDTAMAEANQAVRDFILNADDQTLFGMFNGGQPTPDAAWTERLAELRTALRDGSFSVNVVAMDSASVATSIAAYTHAGPDGQPTVFINSYWFDLFEGADAARVLVEEFGHAVDDYLNPDADTTGDEGEAFAATALNGASATTTTQNDHGTVTAGGTSYNVEFASFNFSNAYQMITDVNNDGVVQNTENWAEKEQESHTLLIADGGTNANTFYGGLGPVGINDDTNSALFSGNDVSAIGINIGGTTYYGWISRPLKVQGSVVGFYFWTDQDFTNLATAQADGNQDADSADVPADPGVTDNKGFVLVVNQSYFNSLIATMGTTTVTNTGTAWSALTAGTYNSIEVGSSSDRVDSALNSLIPGNVAPAANNTSGTIIEQGSATFTYGGNGDGASAILNSTLDYSDTIGDTATVTGIGTTTAGASVSSGSTSTSGYTSVQGLYGELRVGANGSYQYILNNDLAAVQALRLTTNTLTDTFTYRVTDAGKLTDDALLTITITGSNDTPEATSDYNTAKESLLAPTSGAYGGSDTIGYTATGSVLTNDADVDGYSEIKEITNTVFTVSGTTSSVTSATITLTEIDGLANNISGDFIYIAVDTDGDMTTTNDLTWQLVTGVTATVTGSGTKTLTVSDPAELARVASLYSTIDKLPAGTVVNNVAVVSFKTAGGDRAYIQGSSATSVLSGLTLAPDTSIVNGMVATWNGGTATVTNVTRDGSNTITEITFSGNIVPESTTLTFSQLASATLQGKYGTLSFTQDGATGKYLGDYVYTPYTNTETVPGGVASLNDGDSYDEVFTYTVKDALGATDVSTLTITVFGSGNNDPIGIDDVATAVENGGADNYPATTGGSTTGTNPIGNVLVNDSDADIVDPLPGTDVFVTGIYSMETANTDSVDVGSTSSSNFAEIVGKYGTLRIGADGSYAYLVDNLNAAVQALQSSSETLQESFRYTVSDAPLGSGGNLDSATLTVTIQGANDNPIATNDSATAIEAGGVDNNALGFDPSGNVIVNDNDVDHAKSQLSVTSVRIGNTEGLGTEATPTAGTITLIGTYGTLTMNTNGSWSYVVDNNNATVNALAAYNASNPSTWVTESFNYTVSDDDATNPLTDIAVLSIEIRGAADAVSVNNITVNEGSPYAVFTVLGVNGTGVTLSLADGTTNGMDPTDSNYVHDLQYWDPAFGTSGEWRNYTAGSTITIGSTNQLLVRTAFSPEKETDFDLGETFTLTATPTSGTSTVGTATIMDDNTGTYYPDVGPLPNGNPTTDPTHPLDDDRTIDVVGGMTFNEGSTYATFTVSGQAGYDITLALGPTTPTAGDASVSGFTIEYYDEDATTPAWVAYNPATDTIALPADGSLKVRVNITSEDDTPFEGAEDFTLTATYDTNSSITDNDTGTIIDDGTGKIDSDGDGGADEGGTKDDDRTITITGGNYNENSPRALFTVNANPGQWLTLDVRNVADAGKAPTGDNEGKPDDSLDTAPIYYSLDGGRTWDPYTNEPVQAGPVPVLVAVDIANERDTFFEGEERFQLLVNPGQPTEAAGYASIFDDGTGDIVDETGVTDPTATKDDDRPVAQTPPPPPAPAPEPAPAPAPEPAAPPPAPEPTFNSATEMNVSSPTPVLEATTSRVETTLTSDMGFPVLVLEPGNTTLPPNLSLANAVTDQFAELGTTSSFALPYDTFAHTKADAQITLTAKLQDGSDLPSWVVFDPQSGTFTVTPPADLPADQRELKLMVIARDQEGREAVAPFRFFVGDDKAKPKTAARPSLSEQLKLASKRGQTPWADWGRAPVEAKPLARATGAERAVAHAG
ncbi:VCBS domain-containing protein [Macromonas nakdongensis]|uniref:VCBS domain-containing protein n=1 Tax=Macromonas nakdongensis TaxID=1843082 RepID=UPI000C33F831|nr:VCBS domain-containing protein [Macromonas nakdongensis]